MIRRSTMQDSEAIYQLTCELENSELPYTEFMRIYYNQSNDDRYVCLVSETDEKINGFLNLRIEGQLHHVAGVAEILELSVTSNARNRGIGKELLSAACLAAKERGCVLIEAASNKTRIDAHRFYEREGMQSSHFKFTRNL